MLGDAMHYLYKITNLRNGKVYIGQTTNPRTRWKTHVARSRSNPARRLHKAIAKYGILSFTMEVVSCVENAIDTDAMEVLLIAQHRSQERDRGYNAAPGGTGGGPGRGFRRSEETKAKIRQSLLGRGLSVDRRKRMSLAHVGKPLSEGQRAALHDYWTSPRCGAGTRFQPGAKPPKTAFKRGHRPWNVGKPHPESVRMKIGDARRGRTKFRPDQIVEMARLCAGGSSMRAVARLFDTNHHTVKRLAAQVGG